MPNQNLKDLAGFDSNIGLAVIIHSIDQPALHSRWPKTCEVCMAEALFLYSGDRLHRCAVMHGEVYRQLVRNSASPYQTSQVLAIWNARLVDRSSG